MNVIAHIDGSPINFYWIKKCTEIHGLCRGQSFFSHPLTHTLDVGLLHIHTNEKKNNFAEVELEKGQRNVALAKKLQGRKK